MSCNGYSLLNICDFLKEGPQKLSISNWSAVQKRLPTHDLRQENKALRNTTESDNRMKPNVINYSKLFLIRSILYHVITCSGTVPFP